MHVPNLATEAPVPVVQEPYHHVVLENDYVRVIDVQIPPGATTRLHTHDVASVIVYLSQSTNASQTAGESTTTPRETTPGGSRYAAYDEQPLTHIVTNTGTNRFRVLDIELVRPLPAAGPFPLSSSVAIEPRWAEKRVRSSLVRLDPADGCAVPGSACAHLLIAIDAAVTATVPGDAPADRTVAPQGFAFFPAQIGFQIRNPGPQPAQCVLLELK
jgi:hypothetical protein